jgi:hypothetical protein
MPHADDLRPIDLRMFEARRFANLSRCFADVLKEVSNG